MIEKDILIDKKNMYRLFSNDHGDLFFATLCGSIGFYEIKFQLNEEEVAEYQRIGKSALDNLSCLVSKNAEFYLKRAIE